MGTRKSYSEEIKWKTIKLRTEIFRGDMLKSSSYLVESYRYQVRLVQSTDSECVVLPLQLEQLTYNYEQISSDPQCTQQIQQFFDEYGFQHKVSQFTTHVGSRQIKNRTLIHYQILVGVAAMILNKCYYALHDKEKKRITLQILRTGVWEYLIRTA
ncbi:hypothetical protein COK98_08910 [Bacillus cereus]|uniref:Insecticide toxin TcdB middle/C-terminal domain-containing protein n=1 Tax=Bacillus cereus TaxID=1396 RepID=A0A9X7G8C8_BACCE|nr:hypothetical protein CON26_25800 [Bacillus cereus]PFV08644.1 hypothetical protein COK98_08910 [Bacillus cereus]